MDGDQEYEWTVGGHYVDKCVKRNGEWRILHRESSLDWSKVTPVEAEHPPEALLQVYRKTV